MDFNKKSNFFIRNDSSTYNDSSNESFVEKYGSDGSTFYMSSDESSNCSMLSEKSLPNQSSSTEVLPLKSFAKELKIILERCDGKTFKETHEKLHKVNTTPSCELMPKTRKKPVKRTSTYSFKKRTFVSRLNVDRRRSYKMPEMDRLLFKQMLDDTFCIMNGTTERIIPYSKW